jgi:hypothetical protein
MRKETGDGENEGMKEGEGGYGEVSESLVGNI